MARSVPVGGIHISITGNSVDFRKAVKSAKKEIWQLKAAFKPLTGMARTAGIALAAAGASALIMGKNLAEGIDKLGKLSTSLRTSVADLQAFEMAAGLQGVDFTKSTNALKKLQVIVGDISSGDAYSEVTDVWDRLGLKIEDIVNLPVVEQFKRITNAIRENIAVGEQAAAASTFFGTRNAVDAMRMTAETIEQSNEVLREYGITLTQTAARDTEAMNDAMLVLSLIFKNFTRNIVAEHAPAVKAWVKQVQRSLKPGGDLRVMIERIASGFRIAAQATLEFVDIVSQVVTRERAMTAAMAAIFLAGTRIALTVASAALALGKFTAAMIAGQSVASGFAVVLGILRGGVGGLVTTLAALGLAVAGGVALHKTLTAEFGAAGAAAASTDSIVQSLASNYDALASSIEGVAGATDGMTEASRRAMQADIQRLRMKATFEEAGVLISPEFGDLSGRIEKLRERRAGLMNPNALANAMSQAQGHMTEKQFIEGRRDAVRGIDAEIATLTQEQNAMLENVHQMRDDADAFEQKLMSIAEVTSSEVSPAIAEASEEMSDFGQIAQTAFEKMEGSFDSWFDKYRDGLADAGDLFDTFARAALKHLVKLWAFQPLMGALGGGEGLLGSIFGFKSGGHHAGGWAVFGENGPELVNTGPSRIYSNADSRRMLNGTAGVDVNITVGGNRDDIENAIEAKIVAMAPELAAMAAARVTLDAGRPSELNSRIRSAR